MRWQNNPTKGDHVGQGGVNRDGIAALNPINGMAYSWNPTRARGVGVQDMMATSQGLYVGSDTTLLGHTDGNRYHARIGLLPTIGGKTLPAENPFTLPTTIYSVASGGSQLVRRSFSGTTVGASANVSNGDVAWNTVVGAFMVNGYLYTATSAGVLTKRTFDGTTYGTSSLVNAADLGYDPADPTKTPASYQTDWHVTDMPTLTSLFYSGGRIYFTLSGVNALYSRGFEDESDIVGQLRYSTTTTGIDYTKVRGAFVAGGKLYFGYSTGQLYSATWNGTGPAAGTPATVATTGWSTRAAFPYQDAPPPVNQVPTASATVTCAALTCTFDGSGSSDPDGTVTAYDWDFGDGSAHDTTSGVTATHTYASAGDYPVTLKVTDNSGGTATTTRTASANATATPIGFVDGASTSGNRTTHSVKIPTTTRAGDTLLLFFVGNTNTPTYTGPAGWTPLQSIDGSGTVGRAYRKQATASDIGATVSVVSSTTAKDTTTVGVYRGVDASAPVATSAAAVNDEGGTTHTTPAVEAPNGRNWLVSYWADKSAATTVLTAPKGQTQRAASTGTSSGHTTGLLADSNGTVNTGTNGDLTATADSAGSRDVTFSVLLAPGAPNNPPVANATVTGCTDLSCTFDGSGSTDPDGDALTYDWNFGDGTAHGTTAKPTHAYATSGDKTVTLTVTDGRGGTNTSAPVTAKPTNPPRPNAAPVAHATTSGCAYLSCTFDGSTSNDPDGDAITYDWNFGDGSAHSTEVSPTHAYATSGARTVTLTVTDTKGATGTDSVQATPQDPPTTDTVSYVAGASTKGNRVNHSVVVPTTVQPGDTLLLFFSAAAQSMAYTTPPGWTQVEGQTGGSIYARAYTRTAVNGDAGSTVTITSSPTTGTTSYVKDVMSVVAYRGTSATQAVSAHASALSTTTGTVRTTPTVNAADGKSWLVSFWSDRSSGVTTSFTGPASQTARLMTVDGTSGHIDGLLTDSNGAMPSGTRGGLDATTDVSGTAAATFSILISGS